MDEIKEITFEQINDIWLEKDMWGDPLLERNKIVSNPVQMSLYWDGVEHLGGINEQIQDLSYSNPTYYGYFKDNYIVGVNSFFRSNDKQCRSRGLYVYPEFRNEGIGKKLLRYAIEQNRNKDYDFIWSIPRTSGVDTYQKVGFEITTGELTHMPVTNVELYYPCHFCRYNY